MSPEAVPLPVAGPFDLNASTRFLEGFTPAGRPDAGAEPDLLRLAFLVEGAWVTVGAAVRQHRDRLTVELAGSPPDPVAGTDQVARMLSLDVDGRGFADVGQRDPVVAALQRRYRGLRPVLFPSPYEAACWSIIGQRIRMRQAAAIKARIAETLGETIDVAGQQMTAFPAPGVLRDAVELAGLPPLKVERLRGVAAAALDGRLSAARLRSLDTADALDELTALPGIGLFSAQLDAGARRRPPGSVPDRRAAPAGRDDTRLPAGRPHARPADCNSGDLAALPQLGFAAAARQA